jgi:hypothetical protein
MFCGDRRIIILKRRTIVIINGILEVTVSLSDRNTNLADWGFSSLPQMEVNTDAVP